MLVEDEELLRAGVQEMLEIQGFKVITAPDGQQALACLAAEAIDLDEDGNPLDADLLDDDSETVDALAESDLDDDDMLAENGDAVDAEDDDEDGAERAK